MKTKTIYHLDHDCNIVGIEVRKKSKKKRPIIMNIERLFESIKIDTSLSHHESHKNLEDQVKASEICACKVLEDIQRVVSLQKRKLQHEPTNIPVHIFHVDRIGKKIYCRETGQKLPSTRQGKIDWDQLVHEISLRRL